MLRSFIKKIFNHKIKLARGDVSSDDPKGPVLSTPAIFRKNFTQTNVYDTSEKSYLSRKLANISSLHDNLCYRFRNECLG